MILSGNAIVDAVKRREIEIDPFEPAHVNPASIDLTLGDLVREVRPPPDPDFVWDVKKGIGCGEPMRIGPRGFVIERGRLYLMHTAESIHTTDYVPVIDGKSSIGRIGVVVHLTAGYGDPGYRGQYTLEVTSVHPVRLYAGMRICQMRFHLLRCGEYDVHFNPMPEDAKIDYQKVGHYVGEQLGPQPSRVHEQFKKE